MLFHFLSPFHVSFSLSFFTREKEQHCLELRCGQDENDLLTAAVRCKHSHLLNVFKPKYCMFIKRSRRYKQENAIVPSRKWSRNTGGPQTMDWGSFLHCESVGQEKAHGCGVKIGVIIIWFTLPPCSSEPHCGPYWQWPIWREETWIHPNFLSFAFRTASSSLPLSLLLPHVSRNWLKP